MMGSASLRNSHEAVVDRLPGGSSPGVLQELGAEVHLVNPSGLAWGDRRVKNDYRDCCDLIERMRLGKLPEAWIAPPATRELRELVRFRHKLMQMRTGLKAQVKAVVAKHGLHPPVNDLWGPGASADTRAVQRLSRRDLREPGVRFPPATRPPTAAGAPR